MSKLTIGLTGGIGCGKTTVANLFAELGITIIDADLITRELTGSTTPLVEKIKTKFGSAVFHSDGSLDRQAMRQHIFTYPEDRVWLEKLLHPEVRRLMQTKIEEASSSYVILVIPLLIENLPNPLINRILVVDCEEATQIKRATQRDRNSIEQIQAIMSQQVSRTTRLEHADDIIENDGDLIKLRQEVIRLHKQYIELSNKT